MKPVEPCAQCGENVNAASPRVVVEMAGWARRQRAGGGLNALVARHETGRVLCERCFARRGTDTAGQGTFL